MWSRSCVKMEIFVVFVRECNRIRSSYVRNLFIIILKVEICFSNKSFKDCMCYELYKLLKNAHFAQIYTDPQTPNPTFKAFMTGAFRKKSSPLSRSCAAITARFVHAF